MRNINLQLDAHRVSMRVPDEQETIYRSAAASLNQLYQRYHSRLPKATVEQLWMYVALDAAVRLESDERRHSLEPIEQKLNELNQLIQENLC